MRCGTIFQLWKFARQRTKTLRTFIFSSACVWSRITAQDTSAQADACVWQRPSDEPLFSFIRRPSHIVRCRTVSYSCFRLPLSHEFAAIRMNTQVSDCVRNFTFLYLFHCIVMSIWVKIVIPGKVMGHGAYIYVVKSSASVWWREKKSSIEQCLI